MHDGIIEQDMSPGSNSTKRVGRILTLLIIIIISLYVMHMSEFVFCQTQISMSHISAYENDFHLKF